jgi:hypothetical protein
MTNSATNLFILAPKIIVYDNACNLHSYCLNRDPLFFKETKFLVDRFHWKNHRGIKLVTNEQVFYDNFSYNEFYLPVCLRLWQFLPWQVHMFKSIV